MALDLAVACGIAQVTATSRLAQVEQLVGLLPWALALLGEGRLRVGQALVSRRQHHLDHPLGPDLPQTQPHPARRPPPHQHPQD